jgi:hypothetical protein
VRGGFSLGLVVGWLGLARLPFGTLAEAVLQGRVEFLAQLGDLAAQPSHFAERLPQQRLERRHVFGKRRIRGKSGGVHAL